MNDIIDKCIGGEKAKSNYRQVPVSSSIEGQGSDGSTDFHHGPMIVASLALAVGSIGHSTGLVGRSLLLKKEYINWWAQITARSSYLHIHLKTLKIGGKIDWFSQVRLSYWSDFSKPCVQKKGLDRHSYSVTPILNSTSYAIFSKNVFLTNPIIAFA